MKICFVLGTRPEIIKTSPVIKQCQKEKINFFIIHTGQHYSYFLDKTFFEELNLPNPEYNLNIGSGTHGMQTGKMLEKIEEVLLKEKPEIVIVQGDTNSTLAGALAATKLKINVGHIEAGLRSFDMIMPEEKNRKLTDHISNFLFCPTNNSKENLNNEGIGSNIIYITGNTVVDVLIDQIQNLKSIQKEILSKLDLDKKDYFLMTMHREENVDYLEKLRLIFKSLIKICKEYNLPIITPIHPRTKKMLDRFNIKIPPGVIFIDPQPYSTFLTLEANSKLILTDSGGIQEEACVLRVPCVTLRESTERPESIEVGANILVGTESKTILKGVEKMLNVDRNWYNPFGDGKASKKIIEIIRNNFK